MGEAKRQSQKGSGGNLLLILAGIVMLAVTVTAIWILLHIGGTVSEYKKQSAELKAVRAELASAQEERDSYIEQKTKLEYDDSQIESLRDETFKLAAQLEKDIKAGRNNNRICYLTVDDGPYYHGHKLLDILNEYDVKATFFLTTANGDKLPDKGELSAASMYPEYLRYGHTIGNHTYSHNYSSGGIYKSSKAFMNDVKKQEEFTEKATGGYKPQIVRFPGGRATAGKTLGDIEEALAAEGYGWADWTVDSGDSWGKDKASKKLILKQVKKAAKDQKIMVVLCHEWSKPTEEALPEMIEYLEDQGYIFLPMFYESQTVMKE